MRNGRPDAIEAIYEQFRIFHGDAARTGAYERLVENVGRLAATAGDARTLQVWPAARGPILPGTYQAIGEHEAEHFAGQTDALRGVWIFTLSAEHFKEWLPRQIVLPAALVDLGLFGWLFRRAVADVCKTEHFERRCMLEHTPTYCADVAAALVNHTTPPVPPDVDDWLRALIAKHAHTVAEWPELYCAALICELRAHGRRRREEGGEDCARAISRWWSFDPHHPVPHVLRVCRPTDAELARYSPWRPAWKDKGVEGTKGGTLTFVWNYAEQLDAKEFVKGEVAYEQFTVDAGTLTVIDMSAISNHAGKSTLVRIGETVRLCRGLVAKLQWKAGTFAKRYACFNNEGDQLQYFDGRNVVNEKCDICTFHCEFECYMRTCYKVVASKRKKVDEMLCRICYLRLGPDSSAQFERWRHGDRQGVSEVESAAIAAMRSIAEDRAEPDSA